MSLESNLIYKNAQSSKVVSNESAFCCTLILKQFKVSNGDSYVGDLRLTDRTFEICIKIVKVFLYHDSYIISN